MWPALISGIAGLAGSFFSSNTSANNSAQQIAAQQAMQSQTMAYNENEAIQSRAFNADQANQNKIFQAQMSGTAFRRAKDDMLAAGLNPIMMASGGLNASTPSGSQASSSPASVGTPTVPLSQRRSALGDLGTTVSNTITNAVNAKTLDKMTDEIANLKATRGKIEAETRTEGVRAGEVAERAGLYRSETDLKRVNKGPAETEARKAELFDELYKNPTTRKIIQAGVVGSSASNAAKPIFDVVGGVVNSALRKRGIDMLRERMDRDPRYLDLQ